MIYNHIFNNPGTYFNNIVRNLGLSNNVVIWHLNMLCKFEYIQKETIENKNIYFSPHMNPKAAKKMYLSSKEKSQKILNYLKSNNKGVTKTKLSLELKIHPYTLNRYLESLERLNLIIKKNSLKKTLYFLNFDEQFSNF